MRKLFLLTAGMAALAVAATGCKGRTMENMVPTGDTVEVDAPDVRAAAAEDSIAALASDTPAAADNQTTQTK
ncbi:MAG TPA: hypothetical protein DC009_00835 [Porphyromonadaceae bacterium]|nr:hypothetical protein [Porphyromonadaceae bacterium]